MDLGIANGVYYRNEGTHLGNYFGVQNGNNFGFQDQLKQIQNIVTNGLVLNLDATNRRSFVSGSTNWYDLCDKKNNGILNNGANFDFEKKGNIKFDGINDLINIINSSSFNNTLSKTVEIWASVDVIGSNFCVFTTNRGNLSDPDTNFTILLDNRKVIRTWNPSGLDEMILIYGIGNGTTQFYTFSKNKFGTNNGDKTWHQIVGVTNISSNTILLYYDGQLVHQTSITGLPATPNVNLRLGSGYSPTLTDFPLKGKIAINRIYNRALSDSEILQNYNALKYRYI